MGRPVVTLGENIVRIPTAGDFINSFAFTESDGSVTLVDCGLTRAPARIVSALAALGRQPRDVQRIILTHAHSDHAGGAAQVLQTAGIDGVDVHEADAPYVRAGNSAPVNPASAAGRLLVRLQNSSFEPVAVARELTDGDLLDVGGGLEVIHTPGHTPGHVSLLHQPSGVLITGDCIFNPLGRMRWPMAMFCTSAAQSDQSARRFADLEFTLAAFTHGPEIRDRAREQIRNFIRTTTPRT
ncbi:MAG: MBL fold metallo-hydrolase [Actinomycetes bacterium]